jgi:hypothetical protein
MAEALPATLEAAQAEVLWLRAQVSRLSTPDSGPSTPGARRGSADSLQFSLSPGPAEAAGAGMPSIPGLALLKGAAMSASADMVLARETEIGGSGGPLDPPGPIPTHSHTGYMAYSQCLPTRLNPLAERTCFSQVLAGASAPAAIAAPAAAAGHPARFAGDPWARSHCCRFELPVYSSSSHQNI